jgi:hypothetical protein
MIKVLGIETVLILCLIMWLFKQIGGVDQRGGITPDLRNFINWVAIVLLILLILLVYVIR